jgi:hypothetical protein
MWEDIPMPANTRAVALSRRNLLRTAPILAGGGAFLAITLIADRAKAANQISQAAAGYQTIPKSGAQCDTCKLFTPPISCTLVQGNISAQGWCKYFVLRT